MCMSAVTYVMNIVLFSHPELEHLDVRMRKTLKEMNWKDEKSSEERLYMTVEAGGKGLLLFKYIYNIAKIRISNYLSHTEDPLLQTVLNRELAKTNSKSIMKQAELAFHDVDIKVKFDRNKILVNGEELRGNHHQTASKLKIMYQKKYQEKLEKACREKKVQSEIWNDITEGEKSLDNFKWIRTNMTPEKVGQIIRIQEQMIPTRTSLQMQGKHQETTTCRLCEMQPEGTHHWMSVCPTLQAPNI